MSDRPTAPSAREYKWFTPITTRWHDNDLYGHINNVVYYSFFDTAVNSYLIEQGVLDIHEGNTIGLVVHSACHYFAPLAFPDKIQGGLRVEKIGTSSVEYHIGIFKTDDNQPAQCAAAGHFIHVYVDRATNRPAPLRDDFRSSLSALLSSP